MDLFQTNECVRYFLELYPSMTAEQGVALRDAIGGLELSIEAFKAEARRVVVSERHINDAIPALVKRLSTPATFTASPRVNTWVDEANEASRRERQKVAQQHAEDDELIRITPADRIDRLMHEVIVAQAEPVRSIWKKKGLSSRAVRCSVAARLRVVEGLRDGSSAVPSTSR